ncbi:MAG: aldehyde dehydrogenase family protein [Christensenellales bacterium]
MKMLIGGKFCDASNGSVIEITNPATLKVVDTVPGATCEDVSGALELSRKGFTEWSSTPLYRRIEVMYRYADLLDQNREQIAQTLCAECGKPITQARGETAGASFIFRCYAEKARTFMGDMHPVDVSASVENDVILCTHQPLGVIACVIPFNYPVDLYAEKVAPALVAGNAVIIKPSSDTPLADIMMTGLLLQAGVPGNAAQIITGSGAKVGKWLCESPLIDGVFLTGSTEVGIETALNSAKCLHRLELELGGNDPFIICEDADLDKAVAETISGRITNAGQTCCASKRMIVHNSIRDIYVEKLTAALKKLKIGDPAKEDTDCGSLINEKAAKTVEEQVNFTISQGARCVYGGHRFQTTFFEPTVLVDVTAAMDIARDMEVFGPVIPVIGFDTFDEAIAIANQTKYGLQGGVMTSDMKKAFKAGKMLACGCVTIGGSGNYRSVLQPFGGWKMSGYGNEGVGYTLDEVTRLKTIAFKKILE